MTEGDADVKSLVDAVPVAASLVLLCYGRERPARDDLVQYTRNPGAMGAKGAAGSHGRGGSDDGSRSRGGSGGDERNGSDERGGNGSVSGIRNAAGRSCCGMISAR